MDWATSVNAEKLVSVIVPTFNRAYCIADAIDSALNQYNATVEVIVVDDGSTDSTTELIKARYGADGRVKYIHQMNQGVSAARNRGLREAQGAFIALLDSDDVWKPWKLGVQLECMARFPKAGMVWSDMEAVDPDGNVIETAYIRKMYSCFRRFSMKEIFEASYPLKETASGAPVEISTRRFYVGDIYSRMFMGSLVHTSTVLMRRERFERVRQFDEALKVSGEDYDFHLRTCREGPVGFVDCSSIRYQIGMPDRLTQHKYSAWIAGNCLRTITSALAGREVNLPTSMIEQRLAEVHAWLGEALLENQNRPEAREHLLESIRHDPWQPRVLRLLTLTVVPSTVEKFLRTNYRRLKRRVRVDDITARSFPVASRASG